MSGYRLVNGPPEKIKGSTVVRNQNSSPGPNEDLVKYFNPATSSIVYYEKEEFDRVIQLERFLRESQKKSGQSQNRTYEDIYKRSPTDKIKSTDVNKQSRSFPANFSNSQDLKIATTPPVKQVSCHEDDTIRQSLDNSVHLSSLSVTNNSLSEYFSIVMCTAEPNLSKEDAATDCNIESKYPIVFKTPTKYTASETKIQDIQELETKVIDPPKVQFTSPPITQPIFGSAAMQTSPRIPMPCFFSDPPDINQSPKLPVRTNSEIQTSPAIEQNEPLPGRKHSDSQQKRSKPNQIQNITTTANQVKDFSQLVGDKPEPTNQNAEPTPLSNQISPFNFIFSPEHNTPLISSLKQYSPLVRSLYHISPTYWSTNQQSPISPATNQQSARPPATDQQSARSPATNQQSLRSPATNQHSARSPATCQQTSISAATDQNTPKSSSANEHSSISPPTIQKPPASPVSHQMLGLSPRSYQKSPTSQSSNTTSSNSVSQTIEMKSPDCGCPFVAEGTAHAAHVTKEDILISQMSPISAHEPYAKTNQSKSSKNNSAKVENSLGTSQSSIKKPPSPIDPIVNAQLIMKKPDGTYQSLCVKQMWLTNNGSRLITQDNSEIDLIFDDPVESLHDRRNIRSRTRDNSETLASITDDELNWNNSPPVSRPPGRRRSGGYGSRQKVKTTQCPLNQTDMAVQFKEGQVVVETLSGVNESPERYNSLGRLMQENENGFEKIIGRTPVTLKNSQAQTAPNCTSCTCPSCLHRANITPFAYLPLPNQFYPYSFPPPMPMRQNYTNPLIFQHQTAPHQRTWLSDDITPLDGHESDEVD